MKANLETIQDVLNDSLIPKLAQKLTQEIERQAALTAEEEKAQRPPVQKKQFVIIVSDPNGVIQTDLVGWVAQIPEDDAVGETMDRLIRASYEYNISKKGRKYPVKTVGEACEAVSGKFLKEQDLWMKTKEPVQVIVTDNVIPEIEDDSPTES